MTNTITNPCVRCGKQRIDGKTWVDETGYSKITRVTTVCPDPECQAEVDKAIIAAKKVRDDAATKRLKDKEDRMKEFAKAS